MSIRRIVLLVLAAALTAQVALAAGPYQVTGTSRTRDHGIVRTKYTVKAGAHPLDRFKMTRVARDVPAGQFNGTIVFLPPLGTTFSFYEQRDPNGAFGSFNASEARIYDDVARFVSYVPLPLVRDVSCSLAGVENQFTANLGNFHGAVLAIGGGHGFGPYMADQLAQIGSTDKTFRLEPGFGHIDHFMTPQHRKFVEEPIFRWATRLFGGR